MSDKAESRVRRSSSAPPVPMTSAMPPAVPSSTGRLEYAYGAGHVIPFDRPDAVVDVVVRVVTEVR